MVLCQLRTILTMRWILGEKNGLDGREHWKLELARFLGWGAEAEERRWYLYLQIQRVVLTTCRGSHLPKRPSLTTPLCVLSLLRPSSPLNPLVRKSPWRRVP